MELHDLSGAELLELRTRVTHAALKFYESASDFTREQSALPELRTSELIARWRNLRVAYAVMLSAGQEQFELLEVIAIEYQRRAIEAGQSLEGMDTVDAVRYIEDGRADA